MARISERQLLNAIEGDDIDAFNALTDKAQCGELRLGRFPVLSLLYLYNAKKLISSYEEGFIKISEWRELGEPAEIVRKFSGMAGKCLRLYHSRIVSPLEMLLILDKGRRVKKLYSSANPSEEIVSRLNSIYYIKYSLGVRTDDGKIEIDRRPLSRGEKRRIITAALSCAFALAAVIATPVSIVSYVKKHEGDVTSLSQIDFGAQKTYTLLNDITIPSDYSVPKINCNIKGGGHTVTLGENVSLGELGGKISGVEFNTTGSPIFSVCSANSSLSGVTVNVAADVEAKENSAFVAVTNFGTFDGVTVNVSGSVYAAADNADGSEEQIFGGLVTVNAYALDYGSGRTVYGTVKNCTVNYKDFSAKGEVSANATFGGVVGINYGYVQSCTVTGEITADTFDLGGACYINNNTVSGTVVDAALTQTSGDDVWSPIVGGVVIDNTSLVEYSQSTGNITVTGQGTAICGGIAARTYGQTNYCYSSGDITVNAETAYVGGIYGISQVALDSRYVYFGVADHCLSRGNIVAVLDGESFVGGIGGFVQQADVGGAYFGGCVTDCIFTGGTNGGYSYFGNIIGVCAEDIYEANSYISGGLLHANFDGNYYIANGSPSFGAVASSGDDYRQVSGKGATQMTEDELVVTQLYYDILKSLGM